MCNPFVARSPFVFAFFQGLGWIYKELQGAPARLVDPETAHRLGVKVFSWSPSVRRALGLVDTTTGTIRASRCS